MTLADGHPAQRIVIDVSRHVSPTSRQCADVAGIAASAVARALFFSSLTSAAEVTAFAVAGHSLSGRELSEMSHGGGRCRAETRTRYARAEPEPTMKSPARWKAEGAAGNFLALSIDHRRPRTHPSSVEKIGAQSRIRPIPARFNMPLKNCNLWLYICSGTSPLRGRSLECGN